MIDLKAIRAAADFSDKQCGRLELDTFVVANRRRMPSGRYSHTVESDSPLPLGALLHTHPARQDGAEALDGWNLVPVEPTPVMIDAGTDGGDINESRLRAVYKAMLEEAPQPAQQPAPLPLDVPMLTDEEIEREWQFMHGEDGSRPTHHDFANAIEQLVRQKVGLIDSPPWPAQQPDARTAAIKDCIDRLEQGGKPAEAGILRHHFAKDLGAA